MRRLIALFTAVFVAASCCCQGGASDIVFVCGGSFDMGVSGGEDNPQHRIRVNDFWMTRYEVTAGEWKAFTDAAGGWSHWGKFNFTSLAGRNAGFQIPDGWAMYWISWYQAVRYCNWRSEQENLQAAYVYDEREMQDYLSGSARRVAVQWNREANGYRLPTEAEWEYAARGGAVVVGRGFPQETPLNDRAWNSENSGWAVHPIGQKQPNVLGLYDMLGNVGEWCWDYYRSDYYVSSPARDPTGPDGGSDPANFGADEREIRCFRGGTWLDDPEYTTETFRFRSLATLSEAVGLRLVRSSR